MTNTYPSKLYQKYVAKDNALLSLVTIAYINPVIEEMLACDFATEQFAWFNDGVIV